jgi:hypothetical protein
VILEHANLLTGLNIKDLSRSVATSCDIFAVMTEPHTAHDTFVVEGVDKIDVKNALHLRVEDGVPIVSGLLVVRSHVINFEVAECVSHGGGMRTSHSSVVGSRVANLRRRRGSGVRDRCVDLRSCRPAYSARRATNAPPTGTGRSSALWLRSHSVGDGARRVVLRVRSLLRTGVRRDRKTRRSLAHLVLRSQRLFLRGSMALLRLLRLLRTLRLTLLALLLTLLWRCETSLTATSHDTAKKAIAWGDRGRLRRSSMLGRSGHATLNSTLSGSIELMSQGADLVFVPADG